MRRHLRTALIVAAALLPASCRKKLPELPPSQIPVPAAAQVESVLFLVGDAGDMNDSESPLLRKLTADVEDWSRKLARDSAVVVLYLGDNVYPRGLNDPGTPTWARDSAVLESQVNVLTARAAREHGTLGYFIAGNHDWGHAKNEAGIQRLHNQESFLDRRRARGINVRLQPEAGEPGPAVIDIGRHARLLLFDTAWWLLAQNEYLKMRAFRQTEDVMRSTSGRYVLVAAHHPFQSAASHGGLVPLHKALGLRFLLARSGALLQDLNSIVYRELMSSLKEAFRIQQPLIFIGGHDHNLQLIAHDEFPEPRYSIVSGAGSKLSSVGHVPGMLYRGEATGYMILVTHRTGQVDLFVVAGPEKEPLFCAGAGVDLERCMNEGVSKFTTTYGRRLK
jgi:hypothetical protein